ncbi:hypothetical protein AMK59_8772 [Oryctes borbonicus]|uniref:Craniofacial development protein 1 n=1 Tax=Oryctes borbonicus TaxID=1629725 RepID=A0A0T6AUH1_9SCAR|nr:hypothetical protein AMK59_8772 [Oryctes borbonicus]
MDSVEYPDDSDSSDEDYIPESAPGVVVSEAESEGDVEDPLSDKEELGTRSTSKRKKKTSKSRKKLKKDVTDDKEFNESTPEKPELTAEEKKKQEEDLWASFKKETNFKTKPANIQMIKSNDTKENNNIEQKKVPEKIKVTEIFKFAGEEVKVEKEVPVNSAIGRLSHIPSGSDPPKRGRGRGGGIGSLLNQIGKQKKITTLEKSKLDWEKFKKEENIGEELSTFNKGKDGYLDKQDFLQRTDLRRFEIEKDIRNTERNKRMNNL